MQKRLQVGVDPSSKTCPRCPPHVAHTTSVRTIPCERSSTSFTAPEFATRSKLGQPVPESNLLSEENSGEPQPAQWYIPVSWLLTNSPLNGASVPFLRKTSYCSGVSSSFHWSSIFCIAFVKPVGRRKVKTIITKNSWESKTERPKRSVFLVSPWQKSTFAGSLCSVSLTTNSFLFMLSPLLE